MAHQIKTGLLVVFFCTTVLASSVRATGAHLSLDLSEQALTVISTVSGIISVTTGATGVYFVACAKNTKHHGGAPYDIFPSDASICKFFSGVSFGCSAVFGTIAYLAGSKAFKH